MLIQCFVMFDSAERETTNISECSTILSPVVILLHLIQFAACDLIFTCSMHACACFCVQRFDRLGSEMEDC